MKHAEMVKAMVMKDVKDNTRKAIEYIANAIVEEASAIKVPQWIIHFNCHSRIDDTIVIFYEQHGLGRIDIPLFRQTWQEMGYVLLDFSEFRWALQFENT